MLVLATANPHKVTELAAILKAASCTSQLLTLQQACDHTRLPLPAEPDEIGRTFEANCAIKALAYARALQMPCIADDSGLEVDALHGAPGVDSSHYAMLQGMQPASHAVARAARDQANLQLVLKQLVGVESRQRTARFVCVMTLASPSGIITTTRGTMEGRIGIEPAVPRGANGFGYDPIFLVAPTLARTSAELSDQEKNAISHRSQAATAMARYLANNSL